LEPTYDLTVAGPENFLANGMVVHNTGKTELVRQLAVLCNANLWEINGDTFMQRSNLIGRWIVRNWNRVRSFLRIRGIRIIRMQSL
jgi:hypothetical protein